MGELTRKTFYRPVDRRSKTAMTAFLENHFRYDTANGWNRSTSYACNMKLYNLDLPRALEDKLFDMLEVPEFYEPVNRLRQDFAEAHDYLWQTGFNGRSGGYLVLYQGGCRPSAHRSYCTHCGQQNFTSVSETGIKCGLCGAYARVDFKQPPLEVFAYPMRGVDSDKDFEDWSLQDLQQRTALVQELDRLADAIVTAGIEMAERFEVREKFFQTRAQKVLLVTG